MFDKLDFDKLESCKLKMEQFTDDILIEQFLPLAITNNKYLYPYIDKMISDIDITEEIYFKSLDLYNNNKEILTLENFLSVESSKYIKKCYILMKMDELDSRFCLKTIL